MVGKSCTQVALCSPVSLEGTAILLIIPPRLKSGALDLCPFRTLPAAGHLCVKVRELSWAALDRLVEALEGAVELSADPEGGEENDEEGGGDPMGPEFDGVDEGLRLGEGVDLFDESIELVWSDEVAS